MLMISYVMIAQESYQITNFCTDKTDWVEKDGMILLAGNKAKIQMGNTLWVVVIQPETYMDTVSKGNKVESWDAYTSVNEDVFRVIFVVMYFDDSKSFFIKDGDQYIAFNAIEL